MSMEGRNLSEGSIVKVVAAKGTAWPSVMHGSTFKVGSVTNWVEDNIIVRLDDVDSAKSFPANTSPNSRAVDLTTAGADENSKTVELVEV